MRTDNRDRFPRLLDMDHTDGTYAAAERLKRIFDRVVVITPRESIASRYDIIVAGASAGGVEALSILVSGLPAGSDFPSAAADPEAAWREAKTRLEDAHRRLHADLLALDDARLDDPAGDSTVRAQLLGLLQHHAYHGGQILMLARAGAGSER